MSSRVCFLLILFPLLAAPRPALAQRSWRHLDNVSLVDQAGNDGDSFHARRNRSSYLFRLYFVDTPETDARFPERLREQADYFGIPLEQVVDAGKMADAFTKDLLAKRPFSVYTKYRDAMGASTKNRTYGMVKVNERWLCELLVENGLARIHGVGDDLPDGVSERRHWARLRTLENTARREKRGIWGMNEPAARLARAGGTVKLDRPAPIFRAEAPFALAGTLPAGHEIVVGDVVRPGFRAVEFQTPAGNTFRGHIQEVSLPSLPQ